MNGPTTYLELDLIKSRLTHAIDLANALQAQPTIKLDDGAVVGIHMDLECLTGHLEFALEVEAVDE